MKFAKIAFIALVSLSAQAFAGGACFYEHANFQGRSFCLRAGEQVSSVNYAYGMNDMISSIRMDGDVSVDVYRDDNYSGDRTSFYSSTYAVPSYWNDQISSIVVNYDRGGRDDRGGYDRGGRDDRGGYDRGGRDDRGGYDRGGRRGHGRH